MHWTFLIDLLYLSAALRCLFLMISMCSQAVLYLILFGDGTRRIKCKPPHERCTCWTTSHYHDLQYTVYLAPHLGATTCAKMIMMIWCSQLVPEGCL